MLGVMQQHNAQPRYQDHMEELSESDLSEINELLEDEQPSPSYSTSDMSSGESSPRANTQQKPKRRRLWNADEDEKLRAIVKHVIANSSKTDMKRLPWLEISKHIVGRSAKQCRDRWGSIDSKSTRAWSPEEDQKLLELYAQFSNKWVKIAAYFTDRNDNMVKSRFRALQKNGKISVPNTKSSLGPYNPMHGPSKRSWVTAALLPKDSSLKRKKSSNEEMVVQSLEIPESTASATLQMRNISNFMQVASTTQSVTWNVNGCSPEHFVQAPQELLPQQHIALRQMVGVQQHHYGGTETENDWVSILLSSGTK
jgi:hypothetical protein